MGAAPRIFYEFGPFRVDPDKRLLLRENQPVAITPKALETLLVLLRHNQELVPKDVLMKELWPDAFVEEANLVQNIFTLRKALGDTPDERRYIVTLPGRGYRFAAKVRTATQDGDLVIASRTRSQFTVTQEENVSGKALPALDGPLHRRIKWKPAALVAVSAALLVVGAILFYRAPQPASLGEKDSVLIADFANTTGDPVFDDALRQGLAVQLEQSPFLSVVSEDRVQHTLRLMGQPPDARVTSNVAREVCERTGSAAVLEGSIGNLGSRYVVGLRATNCRTGDLLDVEQAQAAKKEEVLNALTEISRRFRTRVGESLATIHQHDTPLAEATTPSLDALKAYSIGSRLLASTGDTAALPFFERAIQLDPQFAMAYAWKGRIYGDLGEAALSAQSTAKAYELRDRASDPERFWITAAYEMQVTENLIEAQQTCEVWKQTYPRDWNPHGFLAGVIYPVLGKYDPAVREAKTDEGLNPDFAIIYYVLATRYQALGRFDEAEKALEEASQRRLNIPDFLMAKYDLAFVRDDGPEMDRMVQLAREDPTADEWVTDHKGFVLAYSGRLQDATKTSRRAEDLARQAGHREAAALYEDGSALWQGFFGNIADARRSATAALALSNDRGVGYGAALALALTGDLLHSQQLANDLDRRFPEDTSVQFNYLPSLRAQLALSRGEPARAIDLLQKAAPYELGMPRTALHANFGALYPVYVRGEAYLAERNGPAAAAEFQKILDHRGIVASDPIGALAHLQLARAYEIEAQSSQGAEAYSARGRARAAYQHFLTLWKDADPDVPILKKARAEYAKLQ